MSKEHEEAVSEVRAAQVQMERLRPRPGSKPSPEELARFETARLNWTLARARRVAAARRDVGGRPRERIAAARG